MSVGIIITLSVVRTILSVVNIYSVGYMHICISCKHFATIISVTLSVVNIYSVSCMHNCVSCTHYSSCRHYSVGCMPYSVSCVHYSVKLWKAATRESFHCGRLKEPATYSWSAALCSLSFVVPTNMHSMNGMWPPKVLVLSWRSVWCHSNHVNAHASDSTIIIYITLHSIYKNR